MSSKAWGHKITISIYVKGEVNDALTALANSTVAATGVLHNHGVNVDFVGIASEEVKEKPKDQGAS